MLDNIGEIAWIQYIMDKEKSIIKYIYNHRNVLDNMRIYTEGKELVCPVVTRFATNLISLQSVADQKENIKRMFLGP
jgi:hypothetical protein